MGSLGADRDTGIRPRSSRPMGSRAYLDHPLLGGALLRVDRLAGPNPVRRVRPDRQRPSRVSARAGVGAAGAGRPALGLERGDHGLVAAKAGQLAKHPVLRLNSDQPAALSTLGGDDGDSAYFSPVISARARKHLAIGAGRGTSSLRPV